MKEGSKAQIHKKMFSVSPFRMMILVSCLNSSQVDGSQQYQPSDQDNRPSNKQEQSCFHCIHKHVCMAMLQARGAPRQNATAKDSEWVRTRQALEKDKPSDVNEVGAVLCCAVLCCAVLCCAVL